MVDSRRSAAFILATLALTALMLAGVALVNWKVDPFQQYRLAPADQSRFPRALQRYINPGLAKNADYDFVITGSSLMENYDLAIVNRLCRAKSINLATSAMAAFEQRKILDVALKHRAPRRVVLTLDFNSFAPPADSSLPEIPDPLPVYLYDDNTLNDFRYLLSGPVTMRTLSILRGVRIGNYSTEFNRAWNWEQEVTFSRSKALKDIDPDNINRRFKQGPRTTERMHSSFDINILSIIAQHPGTEFNLVFPPYSVVVWADFVQRGQLDVSLQFKRHVFQRMKALPNARVFDFQWDADIIQNLNLYTDIYHFNPRINQRMLEAVCHPDSRYRVTDGNVDEFEINLRQQALQVDTKQLLENMK
ncbi:MAG: hypothetical protein ABI790_08890 [Betaproteobacteria bacterium]